jgi:hypothetical protein
LLAANQTKAAIRSHEQTTIKATCLTFFWQINPKKIPLSLFYFFGEKEKETT